MQFCLDFINIFFRIETFSIVYYIREFCSKKDIIFYEVEVFLISADFLKKTNKI